MGGDQKQSITWSCLIIVATYSSCRAQTYECYVMDTALIHNELTLSFTLPNAVSQRQVSEVSDMIRPYLILCLSDTFMTPVVGVKNYKSNLFPTRILIKDSLAC